MPRTEERQIYQFSELSAEAKQKAVERNRYREVEYRDWWEFVYEAAETAADLLGIELKRRDAWNMKGERIDGGPTIWFSGFSSQGDGACYEGRYSYRKGSRRDIRKEFPTDAELHRIADDLYDVQRRYFYRLSATIEHRGKYLHSHTMVIDMDGQPENCPGDRLDEPLRDFADWIYSRLQQEYAYLTSDEAVTENLVADNREFLEDGSPV